MDDCVALLLISCLEQLCRGYVGEHPCLGTCIVQYLGVMEASCLQLALKRFSKRVRIKVHTERGRKGDRATVAKCRLMGSLSGHMGILCSVCTIFL